MFKVVEQALGEVIRYGCAHAVSELQMRVVVQTKTVADTIVQAVLLTTGFIVWIVEIMSMQVDKGVNEYRLLHIKEVSMITAGTEQPTEHPTLCLTKTLKMPYASQSQMGKRRSRRRCCSSSRSNRCEKHVLKGTIFDIRNQF